MISRRVFIAGAAAAFVQPKIDHELKSDVFVGGEDSFNVTSTLVMGPTEALLVDCQYHLSEATRLAERVRASGRRLKAIFITHPHDDHYIGLSALHAAFPATPIFMTLRALGEFDRTWKDALAGQKRYIPSETPDDVPRPTPLPSPEFILDGQKLVVLEDLGGDYPDVPVNSCICIPSSRTIVAGDLVFNGLHPWLAGSTKKSRMAWRDSLRRLSSLRATRVIAGHKAPPQAADSPTLLPAMTQYLSDFETYLEKLDSKEAFVAEMLKRYPNLAQPGFLTRAAASLYATREKP